MSEDDDDKVIKVSPTWNTIFTGVFALETVGFVVALLVGVFNEPILPSGAAAAAALMAACVACFGGIQLVKRGAAACGRALSRRILPDDPLAKRRSRTKFCDQMWQLVVHASMSGLAHYILFVEDGGAQWWDTSTGQLWLPHPQYGQTNSLTVHVLYLMQMAIWLVTCFQHRFIEERHKDYFLMYAHHLVTIALVGSSYLYNYVSDVVADLVKIFNYCKLEGPRGLFLLELAFISLLGSWAYYRLYLFPSLVIFDGVIYGGREGLTAPLDNGCMRHWDALDATPSAQQQRDWRGQRGEAWVARGYPHEWSQPGDGTFDVWAHLQTLPSHPCVPLYWSMVALLLALQVMQVVWYFMFLRILYRITTAIDNPHAAASEVYEGDSDDGKED